MAAQEPAAPGQVSLALGGGTGRTLCLLTRVGSSPSPSLKQGTPKLLRTSDCDFVFEWETPLVCPDEVKAEGCSLTDEQLHYSFNLSTLSKSTFKVALLPRRRYLRAAAWVLSDARLHFAAWHV